MFSQQFVQPELLVRAVSRDAPAITAYAIT